MNETFSLNLPTPETKRLNGVRFLTRLLLISGCCNVIALLIGFYGCFAGSFWLPLHQLTLFKQSKQHTHVPTLHDALHHLHALSLQQLIELLDHKETVKEGYYLRDLALSYLVWQHHFDIERALQSLPKIQSKMLSVYIEGTLCKLPVYTGLTYAHYDAALAFGRKERWPITVDAMFALLKNPKTKELPFLKESFCLSSPFQLLNKSLLGNKPCATASQEGWSEELMFTKVLEGDFQQFIACASTVAKRASSTHIARQAFLGFYPAQGAIQAAVQGTVQPQAKALVIAKDVSSAVVTAPKAIKEVAKAAVKVTIQTPAKQMFASAATATAAHTNPKLYIVRNGDSLWKIARTFEVDIDKIKSYNALTGDSLRPGLSLLIP